MSLTLLLSYEGLMLPKEAGIDVDRIERVDEHIDRVVLVHIALS